MNHPPPLNETHPTGVSTYITPRFSTGGVPQPAQINPQPPKSAKRTQFQPPRTCRRPKNAKRTQVPHSKCPDTPYFSETNPIWVPENAKRTQFRPHCRPERRAAKRSGPKPTDLPKHHRRRPCPERTGCVAIGLAAAVLLVLHFFVISRIIFPGDCLVCTVVKGFSAVGRGSPPGCPIPERP